MGGGIAVCPEVFSDVALKNFSHQTLNRSTHCSNLLENRQAVRLAIECALQGIDLTFDATDASQKRLLLGNGVCHQEGSEVCK